MIISLEGNTIHVDSLKRLNLLMKMCERFKDSQGYYGRLYRILEMVDEENFK